MSHQRSPSKLAIQSNHLTCNPVSLSLEHAASLSVARVSSSTTFLQHSLLCHLSHCRDVTVHPGRKRPEHSIYIFVRAKLQVEYLFIKCSCLEGQGTKDRRLCLPFSSPVTHFTSFCVFISWYSQYISDSYDETSGRFHCKAAGSLSHGSCCFAV